MLSGYRTYLAILLTIAPEIFNAIQAGVASGQTWFVIAAGIAGIVFRYLATKPAP